jgi:hypothetical protein
MHLCACACVFPSQCAAKHTEELYAVQGNTKHARASSPLSLDTDEASSHELLRRLVLLLLGQLTRELLISPLVLHLRSLSKRRPYTDRTRAASPAPFGSPNTRTA